MLFKILMGDEEPDEGTVKWGVSTTQAYFPKDHNSYFEDCDYDLIDWMRQFSADKRESYLRTFLGGCSFPATTCTSRSRSSPAARRCAA